MKLTTKIALGGLSLILFVVWLSFFYLTPRDEPHDNTHNDDAIVPPYFPDSAVDVVITWVPTSSPEYYKMREEWYKKTIEWIEDNRLRGETRRFSYRSVDYFRFILRGMDGFVPWMRHLVVVYPDNTSLSPSLNVSSPFVKVVPHSAFIPSEYLPTFNPDVVRAYLHKISDLTTEFVYMNENTLLLDTLYLAYFRNPKSGDYILRSTVARTNNTSISLSTDPSSFNSINYIVAETKKNTYLLHQTDSSFDTLGPILINKKVMETTHQHIQNFAPNLTSHRFMLPSDISVLDLYCLVLFKGNIVSEKIIVEPTRTEVLGLSNDVVEYMEGLWTTGDRVALYIVDEILRGWFRTGKTEFDVALYKMYPKLSRLEINFEDYGNIGLLIALGVFFGGTGCCYLVTRALGGHVKRDKFG